MTNVVDLDARALIEHQARTWLIRLDGDRPLSDTELESLREWMARSPQHHAELSRLSKLWNQANILTELAVPLKPASRGTEPAAGLGRWSPALAAGLVLASAVLGWWYLQHSRLTTSGAYGTTIGQQETVMLPDASSVQLNTNSQIQVSYDAGVRKVRLLRGEALFSVSPDPRRPFVVYAGDSVVQAVGTAFVVRLEERNVDVTVTKGSVDVTGASPVESNDTASSERKPQAIAVRRLASGQAARLATGATDIAVRQISEPELRRQTAWLKGYLVFTGEPLNEVVEEVNRYSSERVEIGDPALASIAIGGRFRVGDLDGVLDVLKTNFGIESQRVGEHNIRLQSRRLGSVK